MSSFAAAFEMDGCVTDTTGVSNKMLRGSLNTNWRVAEMFPRKNPKFDRKDLGR
jgi:hypothetical protein